MAQSDIALFVTKKVCDPKVVCGPLKQWVVCLVLTCQKIFSSAARAKSGLRVARQYLCHTVPSCALAGQQFSTKFKPEKFSRLWRGWPFATTP